MTIPSLKASIVFESDTMDCFRSNSNVVHAYIKDDVIADLDMVKENVDLIIKVSNKKRLPVMVNINGLKGKKEGALEYANNVNYLHMSAIAIVSDRTLANLIGNLYVYLNRNKIPVKIFRKSGPAIDWIEELKAKGTI